MSTNLEPRVKKALEDVKPYLQRDGGDVQFVKIGSDNTVYVKLLGTCANCAASKYTLKAGIEAYLKEEIPEVSKVIDENIS